EPVLDSIIETGEVRRGFLGAQVVDVTPAASKAYDLKVEKGALVAGVLEGKPASIAGLQPGDVVTKIDGRPCRGGTHLVNDVAVRRPGTSINLEVNRMGEVLDLKVDLQERTDAAMALFKSGEIFGAKLVPVTPESARRYGYRGLNRGLIVTEIEQGSVADDADLQIGDVIEGAAGVEVVSAEQLSEIISQASQAGQAVRIIVRRGNSRMLLMLR
ncbi:PDZ domain-containing protein, partial [Rhodopirellula sp.]